METNEKEVYFHEYCEKCQFKNTKETELPCDECLAHPANQNSHKPINFKEEE